MAFTKRLIKGQRLSWAEMDNNLSEIEYLWSEVAGMHQGVLAATSYVGPWNLLSGALNTPAATFHVGLFWLLSTSTANVALHEPGVSSLWVQIPYGNVSGPAGAIAGNIATLDATGKVLSDGGVAPAALMPKAGGTFTGAVSVPSGAAGAEAPQVQEVVKKSGDTMTGALSVGGNLTVTSGSAAIGYGTGAGGTVTQGTSKTTAVTLNKPTGRITMHNAALASGASVVFDMNNSTIAAGDLVVLNANFNNEYVIQCVKTAAGVASIRVTNFSGVSRSDAVDVRFAVIKGATS